jgi:DNA-binding CsgD family transcriptional regulator
MAQQSELSNRELEVIKQLMEGKSNKLIASSLSISERTVEFHLKNIYDKFHVSSRVELVLKLGSSTVAEKKEIADNRAKPNGWHWATSLRKAVSVIGKELTVERSVYSPARSTAITMTFNGAVRVSLTKYAEFSGRATRQEFWWFMLFVTLVAAALMYVSKALGNVFLITMLLPILAVGARRLHDSGKSAWWQLFMLVPFAGIVLLGFLWALPSTSPLPDDTRPA